MRPVRLLIVLVTLLTSISQGVLAGATVMDCSTQAQDSTHVPDCCRDSGAAAGLCHSSGGHHAGSLCKSGTSCQFSSAPGIVAAAHVVLDREPGRIAVRSVLPPVSHDFADQWRPPRLI